jgi:hypothetical protein
VVCLVHKDNYKDILYSEGPFATAGPAAVVASAIGVLVSRFVVECETVLGNRLAKQLLPAV